MSATVYIKCQLFQFKMGGGGGGGGWCNFSLQNNPRRMTFGFGIVVE